MFVLARHEEAAQFLLAAGANPTLHLSSMASVQAARRVGWPALEDKLVALGAQRLSTVVAVAGKSWFGKLFFGLLRKSVA